MQDFDNALAPAIEIEPGEPIVVETNISARPATGPIAVRGSEPGDTLIVTIHSIEIQKAIWWWRTQSQEYCRQGVYKELEQVLDRYPRVEHPRMGTRVDLDILLEGKEIAFSDRLRVPLLPVVGCIGVAPAGKPQPTNYSGAFGGNFDCRDIGPGARVYFPISARGGLLGLCDVHGAQADGEVFPTVECQANVILSAEVRKGLTLPMTFVETSDTIQSIGCGKNVEDAINDAMRGMLQFVQQHLGLGYLEAAQVLGTFGDIRICQVVDPVINMRVVLPKAIVPSLHF
ncbi:MAG: acetamidase/formamidase family protein [Anaerolineae bacterium]|nr:acetamidase/formamidase family protein [Anaerolineae bacterium]